MTAADSTVTHRPGGLRLGMRENLAQFTTAAPATTLAADSNSSCDGTAKALGGAGLAIEQDQRHAPGLGCEVPGDDVLLIEPVRDDARLHPRPAALLVEVLGAR